MAAAACGEGERAAPPDLKLAWAVKQWNGFAGNLLDQPAKLVNRLQAALNIHEAFSLYHRALTGGQSLVEWSERHPDLWQTITSVEQLRHGP